MSDKSSDPNQFNSAVLVDTGYTGWTSCTAHRICKEKRVTKKIGEFENSTMKLVEPFWKSKSLNEMSGAEWEALCDGCARCCLVKFENPETERIEWTDVHCRHLNSVSCSCNIYNSGRSAVSDCVKLTPAAVAEIQYMPPTCAYRLLQEGRDLYWWHPLVSGDTETVHQAGISIRHKSISEIGLTIEDCLNRCLSETVFA